MILCPAKIVCCAHKSKRVAKKLRFFIKKEKNMRKNRKMAHLLAWAVMLTGHLTAAPSIHAQNEVSYERGATQAEHILPPSPEAASAVKYAGVPFSHCMGAAEYEVPLYELKGRELRIPISLRYRSNGIKVDEIAGVAGLGWNLEAGGVITREVVYMPDEFNSWQFYTAPDEDLFEDLEDMEWNDRTQLFLTHTLWNYHDTSADRYSYDVAGMSGQFIITPDREIVQLSGDGVKIWAYQPDYNGPISAFRITGPDGTEYNFTEREVSTRKNQRVEFPTYATGQQVDWTATTAWYLTSITSADRTETAAFTYADGGIWDRKVDSYTQGITYHGAGGGYLDLDNPYSYNNHSSTVESLCSTKVLSSISLRGTTATFSYASLNSLNSQTKHKSGSRAPLYNFPRRLTEVTVTGPGQNELVRYTTDTYCETNDGRIILGGVAQYHGDELTDRWSFTYKTLDHQIYRWSQDWFGYYNNENMDDGEVLLPWPGGQQDPGGWYSWLGPGADLGPGVDLGDGVIIHQGSTDPDAARPRHNLSPWRVNRNTQTIERAYGFPAKAHADYMSLLEADHDGAVTEYEYEGAYAGMDGNHSITLGVRVKRIKVKDGQSVRQCRSFSYGQHSVDGPVYPYFNDNVTLSAITHLTEGTFQEIAIDWAYSVHESSVSPGMDISKSKVYYGMVSENIHPSSEDTTGVRTVYYYDITPARHIGHYVYDRIPEHVTDLFSNSANSVGLPSRTLRSDYWDSGAVGAPLLNRKELFRRLPDGTEELYQSEEYAYQSFGTQWILVGYSVSELVTSGEMAGYVTPTRLHHYPVYATATKGYAPMQVIRVGYHASGNDTTVVNTTYLPRPTLEHPVRSESVSISGAEASREVRYTYPDTWQDTSRPQWVQDLVQRHSVAEPLRESYFRMEGNTVTDRTDVEREYGYFTTGAVQHLQPSLLKETKNGTESWREEILARDSHGNPSAVKEKGKPQMALTWGYDGMYPTSVTYGTGAEALTSSYTWSPGIGLTGKTTPSGVTTSYEYDAAGRLAAIKNTEGNVLETFTYSLLNDGSDRRSMRHKVYRTNENYPRYATTVTWWNTLGMHIQDIELAASTGSDALYYAYDGDYLLHDDVRAWLPYPDFRLSGVYEEDAALHAAAYHQDSLAFNYKGYEQSSRDKVAETGLPGYNGLHRNVETDDVRGDVPILMWDEESGSVIQKGVYPASEVRSAITTDADGKVKTAITNRFGKALRSEYGDGGGHTASAVYIYDAHDRLRAVSSGNIALTDTLNMWRYSYDAMGRLSSKAVPGSIREHYTYDSEDRVIAILKGDEFTRNEYDQHGRLTERYLTAGDAAPVLLERHWYDARPSEASALLALMTPELAIDAHTECGLQGLETYSKTAVIDEGGAVSGYVFSAYRYDAQGRLIRKVSSLSEVAGGGTLSEETLYNLSGDPEQTAAVRQVGTDRQRLVTTNVYDNWARPVSTTTVLYMNAVQAAKDVTTFSYDALGRLASTTSTQDGGITVQTTDRFTLQGFLASREGHVSGSSIYKETLAYETPFTNTGSQPSYTVRISGKREQWSETTYYTEGYQYDAAGRVARTSGYTGILSGNMHVICSGMNYSYDPAGNLTSTTSYIGNSISSPTNYSYDGHRVMSERTPFVVSPLAHGGHLDPILPSARLFAYDNRGRMVSDSQKSTALTYNHMDLPATVRTIPSQGDTVLVKYSYLADGTKLSAMDARGNGILYYGPMVYRRDSTGVVSFESAPLPRGRISPGGNLYQLTDHLGSVVAVVSGTDGAVLESSRYGVYGSHTGGPLTVTATSTDGEPLRYRFSGKEDQSVDFGLPYTDFGARHYSPTLCRWLTPDPLSEKYYDVSPYAYCAGDPVNMVDYDGEIPHVVVGAAVGAVISGGVALYKGKSGREFWGAVAGGAVGGAVAAATGGASLAIGGSVFRVAAEESLAGAVGGAMQSIVEQGISCGVIDNGKVARSAGIGAVGGAIASGVKSFFGNTGNHIKGAIQKKYSSPSVKAVVENEVKKEFKNTGRQLGKSGREKMNNEVSSRLNDYTEGLSGLVNLGEKAASKATDVAIEVGKTVTEDWIDENIVY